MSCPRLTKAQKDFILLMCTYPPCALFITVAYGVMVLQVIICPVLIGEFLGFSVHISLDKHHEVGSGGLRH